MTWRESELWAQVCQAREMARRFKAELEAVVLIPDPQSLLLRLHAAEIEFPWLKEPWGDV